MQTALVLGGGGARGAAHIGVLQALCAADLKFDIVTGTSAGSLVGGFFAAGFTPQEIKHISSMVNWDMFPVRWVSLLSNLLKSSFKATSTPAITTDSIVSTKKLERLLKRYLGNTKIKNLPRNFATVAVDLHTGETVVFSREKLPDRTAPVLTDVKLWEAMRSSMAIPVVFSPTSFPPWLLTDGGIKENLPVDLAAELGAEKVIAVDVGPPLPPLQPINFIQIGLRALDIMAEERSEWSTDIPVEVIRPDVTAIGGLDFNRLDEAIEAGYQAGLEYLRQLP